MSDARISEIERRLESAALDIRGLAGGAAFGWQSLREMATEAIFRHATVTITVLGCDRVPVVGCLVTQFDNNHGVAADSGFTDGNGEIVFDDPGDFLDDSGTHFGDNYTFSKSGYGDRQHGGAFDLPAFDATITLSPGIAYGDGTFTASWTGGGGTGAQLGVTAKGGSIVAASVVNPGTGFVTAPVVTVPDQGPGAPPQINFAPDGRAQIHATLDGSGGIAALVIDDPGGGFLCWWGCGPIRADFLLTDSNQGQVWAPPFATGQAPLTPWAFTSPVAYSYQLVPGGVATATTTLDGSGAVASVSVGAPGYNYTAAPRVAIAPPPAQVQAEGEANILGGQVRSLTLDNPGMQYGVAPAVTLDPPSTGTPATAHATIASGRVTALVLDNPGSGYTVTPAVTIGPPDIAPRPAPAHATLTTGGDSLAAIVLDDPGAGYWTVPAVTITPPDRTEYELKLTRGAATAQVRSTYTRADPTTGKFRATFDFTGTSAATATFGGGSAVVILDANH